MNIFGLYILTKEQLNKEKDEAYENGIHYGRKKVSEYGCAFIDNTLKKIRKTNYRKKIHIIRDYIKRWGF